MKRVLGALVAAGVIVGWGCVRIPDKFEAHITVDIRHHIEEQADSVLDFIEGKSDTIAVEEEAPAPEGTSWLQPEALLRPVWQAVSPFAVAYAKELRMSSPVVTEIGQRMRERHAELEALKQQGHAGENNRGYVALREAKDIEEPEQRNQAQRIIAAENKDRKGLYKEVAQINRGDNVTVSMVERVFAQRRLERGTTGELFQLPKRGEDFDAFRQSKAGQRLGEACVPDSWVRLP